MAHAFQFFRACSHEASYLEGSAYLVEIAMKLSRFYMRKTDLEMSRVMVVGHAHYTGHPGVPRFHVRTCVVKMAD